MWVLSGEAAHESDPHMLTVDLPNCWLTNLTWAGAEGFLLYEQLFWPTGQVWAAPDGLAHVPLGLSWPHLGWFSPLVAATSQGTCHQAPFRQVLGQRLGAGFQGQCEGCGFCVSASAARHVLSLYILTSLMRMLMKLEQLCPRGGFLMIFQLVLVSHLEQF